MIGATGIMDADIERRIAQASRVIGALRKTVLSDKVGV